MNGRMCGERIYSGLMMKIFSSLHSKIKESLSVSSKEKCFAGIRQKGSLVFWFDLGQGAPIVDHYFYNDPKVLQHANDAVHKSVRDQFRYFIDWFNSRINNFTLNSDLKFYKVLNKAYVNASRFVPLVAGSYIPLPKKQKTKKPSLT